ncbi:hypothetical protein V8P92_02125 [Acinetobacter baumannii]
MSEFKEFQVNDLVVCTDEGLEAKYLAVKKITGFIDHWGLVLNNGEHWVEKNRFRHAEPEEIAAGHRIDNCTACNGRGEVGNILDGDTCPCCKGSGVELETLDKPENHISPLCKSKDV